MDERSGGCGKHHTLWDKEIQWVTGRSDNKLTAYCGTHCLCPTCVAELEREMRECTKQCVDTLARESKLKAENAKLVARDEVWKKRWGKIDQVLFEVMDAHYSASLPQYLLDEVEDSLEIAMKDIESELPLDEEGET